MVVVAAEAAPLEEDKQSANYLDHLEHLENLEYLESLEKPNNIKTI